jgi:hypothetical protein
VSIAPRRRTRRSGAGITERVLALGTATTLAVDAYVHFHDARFYDSVATSVLSQGMLFRVEAALAIALGLMLLLRPRRVYWAAALLVAASALGAVLLYRYVDVGALGPLPNMYEPTWALPGKLASAWAEAAGTALAALGLLVSILRHRRDRTATHPGSFPQKREWRTWDHSDGDPADGEGQQEPRVA